MSDIDQNKLVERLRARVDSRLAELIATDGRTPPRLDASMRHSLLAPGKRVRAVLVMLAAHHWGADEDAALDAGCAVEMVHSASLVLDDLPSMDDSLLRRGQPANHRVYGEGTAILAAIGLMNRAFGVVAADERLDPAQRARIVAALSWSIGTDGLIAGQEQDLNSCADLVTVPQIEEMHGRKTGALFAAAAEIGAVIGGAGEEDCAGARRFGWRLGVAFQTFDDLIDRFATSEAALKDTGKDAAKPTLVALMGADKAMEAAQRHLGAALGELGRQGDESALGQFVRGLGQGLISRLDMPRLEVAHGSS